MTIDEAQKYYDSSLPSENEYCCKCEEKIIGDMVLVNERYCYCEYCAETLLGSGLLSQEYEKHE